MPLTDHVAIVSLTSDIPAKSVLQAGAALQKQITLRKDLLKDQADAKPLLTDTDALAKKLDALEGKLQQVFDVVRLDARLFLTLGQALHLRPRGEERIPPFLTITHG